MEGSRQAGGASVATGGGGGAGVGGVVTFVHSCQRVYQVARWCVYPNPFNVIHNCPNIISGCIRTDTFSRLALCTGLIIIAKLEGLFFFFLTGRSSCMNYFFSSFLSLLLLLTLRAMI